jgi:hypothetical protein
MWYFVVISTVVVVVATTAVAVEVAVVAVVATVKVAGRWNRLSTSMLRAIRLCVS